MVRDDISVPLVVLVGLDSTVAPQILTALHRRHYQVELAGSGSDTLARFADNVPSLFILNETVSSLDELDFLTQLRSEPHLAEVPFITVVPASAKHVRTSLTPSAGALVTPFTDDALLDTVEHAIESGRVAVAPTWHAGTQGAPGTLSRLTPYEKFAAETENNVRLAQHSGNRRYGFLAVIRLDELLQLNRHADMGLLHGIAEQVAELAAHDATAFEAISVDERGHILLSMPEIRLNQARNRLRAIALRIARHRFQLGNQTIQLTPAIGFAQFVRAVGFGMLTRHAYEAVESAASHLDLEPALYRAKTDRTAHLAHIHPPGWLTHFLNRNRLWTQFILTLVIGLLAPLLLYFALDHVGIDITVGIYNTVVAMLALTVLFIWWECLLAFKKADPPEIPASPYPVASAVIAAYLPNEAEILIPTIEAFLGQRYPNRLQIILAYNTPREMPFEETLREIARKDPRFVPMRIVGSTSKAQNVNVALSHVTGDFVGVFDADHQPDPDSFRRAWRWLSSGADVVQGHCFIRNGDASWVAKMVAVEFEQIYALSHPGRARLHGFGIFGGSNGYWKTDLIRQMRMQGFMLTEDIDSSMRAVIRGHTIVSDPKLVSRELAPETLQALLKQRLRWAQGWLQITLKWTIPGLRSRHLSLRQKLGLFHLLAWREAYAWVSLQIFPLIAFWAYKAGGLANLDWFRPLFVVLTLIMLATGPGQALFTYLLADPAIKKRKDWFVFYVVISLFFYSEYKNIIARIAHLKEAMKERAWVVTTRSPARKKD